MHAVLFWNIVMSLLFKYAAVMSLKGLLEEQQHMRRGGQLNNDKLVFARFHFSFVLLAFNQSRKKVISVLREALKECCWAGPKLKYIPGGRELRRGRHLFPYFHFQHGLCSNFPAISLGLEVGNCQCGFSGKLIRVRAVVHTWALPGKMPAHYWERGNESLYQAMFSSLDL